MKLKLGRSGRMSRRDALRGGGEQGKGALEKKEERSMDGEGCGTASKPLQPPRPGNRSQHGLLPAPSLVQLQQHLLHLSSARLVACLFNCGPGLLFCFPLGS